METRHFRHIRKLIENEIVCILQDQYCQSVDPTLSLRYYLDFKSDTRLLELRAALDRLDCGEFGRCTLCGTRIPIKILEASPAMHICSTCNRSNYARHAVVQSDLVRPDVVQERSFGVETIFPAGRNRRG